MAIGSVDQVRVGHVKISLPTAVQWVRAYTDPGNITSEQPYAYPAYDRYDSGSNERHRLNDADLLAPVLLNVRMSVRSFYGLQAIREQLEDRLADPDLAAPLEQVNDKGRIVAMVTPLYAVLDDPKTKPWGVGGTTLSKVLHRKAPHSLVLHDPWVRASYMGAGGPLKPERERSWAAYMAQLTVAIAEDLQTQRDIFARLDASTHTPGELSPVRLLDILAWRSQGRDRDGVGAPSSGHFGLRTGSDAVEPRDLDVP